MAVVDCWVSYMTRPIASSAHAPRARHALIRSATHRFPLVAPHARAAQRLIRDSSMIARFARPMCLAGAVLATSDLAAPDSRQGFDIRLAVSSPAAPAGSRSSCAPAAGAGMERRIRRLRPSADDGGRDPRGRGQFPQLPRRPLAAGGAPRRLARGVRCAMSPALTPDLRIMDLLDAQPEFTKSFWDYLDILVSDERIENGRAILAKYRRDLRRGREGLRRRPPHHRRDLGRRIRTTAPRSATAR